MRNDPAMHVAFKRDFDIDYAGADPKLQLGYAKGFAAGKQKPTVDFDPTVAAPVTLREIALKTYKAKVEPHLG